MINIDAPLGIVKHPNWSVGVVVAVIVVVVVVAVSVVIVVVAVNVVVVVVAVNVVAVIIVVVVAVSSARVIAIVVDWVRSKICVGALVCYLSCRPVWGKRPKAEIQTKVRQDSRSRSQSSIVVALND